MSWAKGGNLFKRAAAQDAGERFVVLASLAAGRCRVEHIVSSDTPEPTLYDQDQDEWVLLLSGEATLEVAGQKVELVAGDTLHLPARTPHRVLRTSPGAEWLAVHAWSGGLTLSG